MSARKNLALQNQPSKSVGCFVRFRQLYQKASLPLQTVPLLPLRLLFLTLDRAHDLKDCLPHSILPLVQDITEPVDGTSGGIRGMEFIDASSHPPAASGTTMSAARSIPQTVFLQHCRGSGHVTSTFPKGGHSLSSFNFSSDLSLQFLPSRLLLQNFLIIDLHCLIRRQEHENNRK